MNEIHDKSGDHSNFTMLPNFIFWLGLSPYALSLYGYIKQAAGEEGVCSKATRTMAKELCVSVATISDAKKELVKTKLITITEVPAPHGGRPLHHITIIDVWDRNTKAVARRKKESSQKKLASSPGKLASSQGELIKNPLINNPEKKIEKAPDAPAPETVVDILTHPAILEFRKHTRYWPDRELWDEIISTVGQSPGDVAFWGKVLHAFVALHWNKLNVQLELEYFRKKKVPETKANGNGRGGPYQPANLIDSDTAKYIHGRREHTEWARENGGCEQCGIEAAICT